MDEHTRSHLHETAPVVTVPLILLAIPSAIIGWLTIEGILFGGFLDQPIFVLAEHDTVAAVAKTFSSPAGFVAHGFATPALYLAFGGLIAAWYIYMKKPEIADWFRNKFSFVYHLLDQKYYFDRFNETVFATTSRGIGHVLWRIGDALMIDGLVVNGSAKLVGWISGVVRHVQTGYLNHYAFAMISGLILLLGWVVLG